MQPIARLTAALLGVLVAATAAAPASASTTQMAADRVLPRLPSPRPADEPGILAPVRFHSVRLQEMVAELEHHSPTARAMLLAIRQAGFPLEFGTFADVADEMQREYRSWDPGHRSVAGFMAPVVRWVSGLSNTLTTVKILVAVNLATLDEIFEDAGSNAPRGPVPWEEIRRLETLSVLAHEIVHAYGIAATGGDPKGGCHDPRKGERPEDSCVMIGENLVRREIGAPVDWDYGLPAPASLAERYAAEEARRTTLREITAFSLRPLSSPMRPERLAVR